MKKKYMVILPIAVLCLSFWGCSGEAKEKEIKEELKDPEIMDMYSE